MTSRSRQDNKSEAKLVLAQFNSIYEKNYCRQL